MVIPMDAYRQGRDTGRFDRMCGIDPVRTVDPNTMGTVTLASGWWYWFDRGYKSAWRTK